MNITSAQKVEIQKYINETIRDVSLIATVDGQEIYVPLDPDNRYYAEIMRQVAAGTLTIADAD